MEWTLAAISIIAGVAGMYVICFGLDSETRKNDGDH